MTKKENQDLHKVANTLIDKMIENKVQDIETLTAVDKLCRRVFFDIDPSWIRWSYYITKNIMGFEEYNEWSRMNCK